MVGPGLDRVKGTGGQEPAPLLASRTPTASGGVVPIHVG